MPLSLGVNATDTCGIQTRIIIVDDSDADAGYGAKLGRQRLWQVEISEGVNKAVVSWKRQRRVVSVAHH